MVFILNPILTEPVKGNLLDERWATNGWAGVGKQRQVSSERGDGGQMKRKHLRMQGWDFTSPGWYFLTLCTKNMRSEFGTVVNGHMTLNEAGRIADKFWREISEHFPRAFVDEYVVMPNHVHGLIQLTATDWSIEGHRERLEAFSKPVAGSVSTIVRSYKSAVSKALGRSVWQSRFYEVRARDDAARTNIRRYIRDNPLNFEAVMHCGEPQFWGNKALLNLPKVGFLASRGKASLHGALPINPGEAIISGFLSPMERAVFREGLVRKWPMICITACHTYTACRVGIEGACRALEFNTYTACRVGMEGACREGRLLVISPFGQAREAPNARSAVWCNQYVLAHCNRAVIGRLNPDGMLACILHEADAEKEIIYL
jgi:REP element-mobilizing transposase RayT